MGYVLSLCRKERNLAIMPIDVETSQKLHKNKEALTKLLVQLQTNIAMQVSNLGNLLLPQKKPYLLLAIKFIKMSEANIFKANELILRIDSSTIASLERGNELIADSNATIAKLAGYAQIAAIDEGIEQAPYKCMLESDISSYMTTYHLDDSLFLVVLKELSKISRPPQIEAVKQTP